MDGPRDYHTKWSKAERERQIPYDITYMWNLKYDKNELIYETATDSQTQTCSWSGPFIPLNFHPILRRDLWLPRGRGSGGRVGCQFGISRCNLLSIEWINNKGLLCSTGNYIQYLVINHNGKEYEKKYLYLYIWITVLYTWN